MAALKTGNNFSIPKDDFIFVMEDVAEEFAEEERTEKLRQLLESMPEVPKTKLGAE